MTREARRACPACTCRVMSRASRRQVSAIEGRISGVAIAEYLGYTDAADVDESEDKPRGPRSTPCVRACLRPRTAAKRSRLPRKGARSAASAAPWLPSDDELITTPVTHDAGVHPVIECTQNIPLQPMPRCLQKGCISIGEHITSLPIAIEDSHCIDCGMCVASCPGQSIFFGQRGLGDGTSDGHLALRVLSVASGGRLRPRFEPLGRAGARCPSVVRVRSVKRFDKTALVTMSVPQGVCHDSAHVQARRGYRGGACHE